MSPAAAWPLRTEAPSVVKHPFVLANDSEFHPSYIQAWLGSQKEILSSVFQLHDPPPPPRPLPLRKQENRKLYPNIKFKIKFKL